MGKLSFDEMINKTKFEERFRYLEVDKNGHLIMEGHKLEELANFHGTPSFVFSERIIRQNFRNIYKIFKKYFDKVKICYAYKSNSLLSVIQIMREEGAWADVSSSGEYYKACYAGMPADKIVLNGNNKQIDELVDAICNQSIINVDSISEIKWIDELAKQYGKRARINIRVNVDVCSNVIPEFSTALKTSKFGLDLYDDAYYAYSFAVNSKNLEILGIHSHIGSQVENSECYMYAAERIMDFVGCLKQDFDLDLSYINMGGGFGIPFDYLSEFNGIDKFAETISKVFKLKVTEHGLKNPTLMIEPGASIIGTSGITLMRVGMIKMKPNKILAALDGGSNILLRATQGWYTYRALCANKMNHDIAGTYDLVGPLCYEGDIVARNRLMCALEKDDVIAFVDSGAYTTSLLNNYNGKPTPAILMLMEEGNVKVIKRRETLEDLLLGEY